MTKLPADEEKRATEFGLPSVLIEAFSQMQVFDCTGKRVLLHSNVSLSEATTLYRAVRAVKPQISVEIGFAQGISALAILQANADNQGGIHHVIDPFQENYGDAGLAMVAKAGLETGMRFHRKFAEEVIPNLPKLQFGFIDASHLFDLTLAEFVLVDKKLEVGGLLGLHDLWMPSLQAALRYILSNRRYEVLRDFDEPPPPSRPTAGDRLRLALARTLQSVPGGDRIFAQNVLRPWRAMKIPNMVLVRKIAEDNRDWRFHCRF